MAQLQQTYSKMGSGVLAGGLSTFLGIVVLFASSSSIFVTFARQLTGVILLGLLQGLIMLPAVLVLASHCRAFRKRDSAKNDGISMEDQLPVAVVGAAGFFPDGAATTSALWKRLLAASNLARDCPPQRVELAGLMARAHTAERATKTVGVSTVRGAWIDGHDAADINVLGVNLEAARAMDPQIAKLVEVCHLAAQDAGICVDTLSKRFTTGVFVGVMCRDKLGMAFDSNRLPHTTGSGAVGTGGCMYANHVSYSLRLTGPSMVVDTACSSSMVALHLAVSAVRAGECDAAFVAGTNLMLARGTFVSSSMAGLLAVDGRCRSFGTAGTGYGRGETVAAILIVGRKVLDASRSSSDSGDMEHPLPLLRPYASILATATNSDGHSAQPITAPAAEAQERLMRSLLAAAQLRAQDVSYVVRAGFVQDLTCLGVRSHDCDLCVQECHGTGTAVGDPVETGAVGRVLGGYGAGVLPIGSIKATINHTESSAGIAGVIKVLLQLRRQQLAPTAVEGDLNDKLPLAKYNLHVVRQLQPWTPRSSGTRLTALVNSFGFGGSNAGVVLSEPPAEWTISSDVASGDVQGTLHQCGYWPLVVTGASAASVAANSLALAHYLELVDQGVDPTDATRDINDATSAVMLVDAISRLKAPLPSSEPSRASAEVVVTVEESEPNSSELLRSTAITAAMHRDHWQHRVVVLASTAGDAAKELRSIAEAVLTAKSVSVLPGYSSVPRGLDTGSAVSGVASSAARGAFVFCGAGSQWWGMARELLAMDCVYSRTVERIARLGMAMGLPHDVAKEMLAADESTSTLGQNEVSQLSIYACQVAMANQLAEVGIVPAVVVGHSLGEIAAAVVAGCITEEEGVMVIAARVLEQQHLPRGEGCMAAINLDSDAVARLSAQLPNDPLASQAVEIAALNAAGSITVTGDAADVRRLAEYCTSHAGAFSRVLATELAFHSHHLDSMQSNFKRRLASLRPKAPAVTLISTTTGREIRDATHDADYWWHNVRRPVQFSTAMEVLMDSGVSAVVEIGPRPVLMSYIEAARAARDLEEAVLITHCLPRPPSARTPVLTAAGRHVMLVVGQLFARGFEVHWHKALGGRVSVPLPSYVFDRQSIAGPAVDSAIPGVNCHPLLGEAHDGAMAAASANVPNRAMAAVFQLPVAPGTHRWLWDHKLVQWGAVMPGAGFAEMCFAAAGRVAQCSACPTRAGVAATSAALPTTSPAFHCLEMRIRKLTLKSVFRLGFSSTFLRTYVWRVGCTAPGVRETLHVRIVSVLCDGSTRTHGVGVVEVLDQQVIAPPPSLGDSSRPTEVISPITSDGDHTDTTTTTLAHVLDSVPAVDVARVVSTVPAPVAQWLQADGSQRLWDIPIASYFAVLRAVGFQYGPCFRTTKQVLLMQSGTCVARIPSYVDIHAHCTPSSLNAMRVFGATATATDMWMSPSVIDAVLQSGLLPVSAAWAKMSATSTGQPWYKISPTGSSATAPQALPFCIRDMAMHTPLSLLSGRELWVLARSTSSDPSDWLAPILFECVDEFGTPVFEMELELRVVDGSVQQGEDEADDHDDVVMMQIPAELAAAERSSNGRVQSPQRDDKERQGVSVPTSMLAPTPNCRDFTLLPSFQRLVHTPDEVSLVSLHPVVVVVTAEGQGAASAACVQQLCDAFTCAMDGCLVVPCPIPIVEGGQPLASDDPALVNAWKETVMQHLGPASSTRAVVVVFAEPLLVSLRACKTGAANGDGRVRDEGEHMASTAAFQHCARGYISAARLCTALGDAIEQSQRIMMVTLTGGATAVNEAASLVDVGAAGIIGLARTHRCEASRLEVCVADLPCSTLSEFSAQDYAVAVHTALRWFTVRQNTVYELAMSLPSHEGAAPAVYGLVWRRIPIEERQRLEVGMATRKVVSVAATNNVWPSHGEVATPASRPLGPAGGGSDAAGHTRIRVAASQLCLNGTMQCVAGVDVSGGSVVAMVPAGRVVVRGFPSPVDVTPGAYVLVPTESTLNTRATLFAVAAWAACDAQLRTLHVAEHESTVPVAVVLGYDTATGSLCTRYLNRVKGYVVLGVPARTRASAHDIMLAVEATLQGLPHDTNAVVSVLADQMPACGSDGERPGPVALGDLEAIVLAALPSEAPNTKAVADALAPLLVPCGAVVALHESWGTGKPASVARSQVFVPMQGISPAHGATLAGRLHSQLAIVEAEDTSSDAVTTLGGASPTITAASEGTAYVPSMISPFKTYVVLGGTKGFGFETAKYLVQRGACYVVLASRSSPCGADLAAIARLRQRVKRRAAELGERGGCVRVVTGFDVTRVDTAYTNVLQPILAELPPIGGVMLTAMVLEDHPLSTVTWEQFWKPAACKVLGALGVVQWLQEIDCTGLDFALFYSSTSSAFGNAGQGAYSAGNHFMDQLAAYASRVLHLPAVSVCWGPLKSGVLARNPKLQAMLKKEGFNLMPANEALQAVSHALAVLARPSTAASKFSACPVLVSHEADNTSPQQPPSGFVDTISNRTTIVCVDARLPEFFAGAFGRTAASYAALELHLLLRVYPDNSKVDTSTKYIAGMDTSEQGFLRHRIEAMMGGRSGIPDKVARSLVMRTIQTIVNDLVAGSITNPTQPLVDAGLDSMNAQQLDYMLTMAMGSQWTSVPSLLAPETSIATLTDGFLARLSGTDQATVSPVKRTDMQAGGVEEAKGVEGAKGVEEAKGVDEAKRGEDAMFTGVLRPHSPGHMANGAPGAASQHTMLHAGSDRIPNSLNAPTYVRVVLCHGVGLCKEVWRPGAWYACGSNNHVSDSVMCLHWLCSACDSGCVASGGAIPLGHRCSDYGLFVPWVARK